MRITHIAIMALLFTFITVTGIFAQAAAPKAIIKEFSGQVELQQAGSETWKKAAPGQVIEGDTIISTGFKSSALIGIGESLLNVRPLTRLSLREISATAEKETISMGLQAGRVHADVKPPAGLKSSYTVHGPSATASTRGTVFEVDTFSLRVLKGSIEYTGLSGFPVIVNMGGYSYINEKTGRAAPPRQTMLASLNPDMPIGSNFVSALEGAIAKDNSFEVFANIDYPLVE